MAENRSTCQNPFSYNAYHAFVSRSLSWKLPLNPLSCDSINNGIRPKMHEFAFQIPTQRYRGMKVSTQLSWTWISCGNRIFNFFLLVRKIYSSYMWYIFWNIRFCPSTALWKVKRALVEKDGFTLCVPLGNHAQSLSFLIFHTTLPDSRRQSAIPSRPHLTVRVFNTRLFQPGVFPTVGIGHLSVAVTARAQSTAGARGLRHHPRAVRVPAAGFAKHQLCRGTVHWWAVNDINWNIIHRAREIIQ